MVFSSSRGSPLLPLDGVAIILPVFPPPTFFQFFRASVFSMQIVSASVCLTYPAVDPALGSSSREGRLTPYISLDCGWSL